MLKYINNVNNIKRNLNILDFIKSSMHPIGLFLIVILGLILGSCTEPTTEPTSEDTSEDTTSPFFDELNNADNIELTVNISDSKVDIVTANFSVNLRDVPGLQSGTNSSMPYSLEDASFQAEPLRVEYDLIKRRNNRSECMAIIPSNRITANNFNNTDINFIVDITSILTTKCSDILPVGYAGEYEPYDRIENIKITELAITIQDATDIRVNRNHSLGSILIPANITLTGTAVPSYSYAISNSNLRPISVNIDDTTTDKISAMFSVKILEDSINISLDDASLEIEVVGDAMLEYILHKGANNEYRCNIDISADKILAERENNRSIRFTLDITSITTAECTVGSSIRPVGYVEGLEQDQITNINIRGIAFNIAFTAIARLSNTMHSLESASLDGASLAITGNTDIQFSYNITSSPLTSATINVSDNLSDEILV
ncbi:MAG: hypothetical protein HAW61_01030, partial [Candidatus Portiera sp.]|nr:hypothetical protein [Portiera sp.]